MNIYAKCSVAQYILSLIFFLVLCHHGFGLRHAARSGAPVRTFVDDKLENAAQDPTEDLDYEDSTAATSFIEFDISPFGRSKRSKQRNSMLSPRSLGGLPVTGDDKIGGQADMAGICLDHRCERYLNYIGQASSCQLTYKCAGCQVSAKNIAFENMNDICASIRSHSANTVVLATGSASPGQRLKGKLTSKKLRKETAKVEIDWDSGATPLNLNSCGISDLSKENSAVEEDFLSDDPDVGLTPIMLTQVTIALSIYRIAPSKIADPQLDITLVYDPPLLAQTSPNGSPLHHQKEGKCRFHKVTFEMNRNKANLNDGEMLEFVRSFPIPWDETSLIPDENLEIRAQCAGKRDCDLTAYRFCARLLCLAISEEQGVKLETFLHLRDLKRAQPHTATIMPPESLELARIPTPEEIAEDKLREELGDTLVPLELSQSAAPYQYTLPRAPVILRDQPVDLIRPASWYSQPRAVVMMGAGGIFVVLGATFLLYRPRTAN